MGRSRKEARSEREIAIKTHASGRLDAIAGTPERQKECGVWAEGRLEIGYRRSAVRKYEERLLPGHVENPVANAIRQGPTLG